MQVVLLSVSQADAGSAEEAWSGGESLPATSAEQKVELALQNSSGVLERNTVPGKQATSLVEVVCYLRSALLQSSQPQLPFRCATC